MRDIAPAISALSEDGLEALAEAGLPERRDQAAAMLSPVTAVSAG